MSNLLASKLESGSLWGKCNKRVKQEDASPDSSTTATLEDEAEGSKATGAEEESNVINISDEEAEEEKNLVEEGSYSRILLILILKVARSMQLWDPIFKMAGLTYWA